MSLITDYRPETFDKLIGNDSLKQSIKGTIGKVHCYLFHGDRGCGKTTTAYLVARELGVNFDTALWELNCADKTGVGDMRTMLDQLGYAPIGSKVKVFILDECHMLTINAQNSLLKALEEPPSHVYFILCTTNINKVIPTIRSRAESGMFRFRPLSRRQVAELVEEVAASEEIALEPKLLRAIINSSDGIPREALGKLEKVQYIDDVEQAIIIASEGIEDVEVIELLRLICSVKHIFGTGEKDWANAKALLKNIDNDPEEIRRAILKYLEKVVVDVDNPRPLFQLGECFEDDYFSNGRFGLLQSVYVASQLFL